MYRHGYERRSIMDTRQTQLFIAGALVLATVLAGAAARGTGAASIGGAATTAGAHTFTAASPDTVSFRGTLDRSAVLLGSAGTARMELAIAAAADPTRHDARRPTDLVIILD